MKFQENATAAMRVQYRHVDKPTPLPSFDISTGETWPVSATVATKLYMQPRIYKREARRFGTCTLSIPAEQGTFR